MLIVLRVNEPQNVRVRNAHHSHVRAASHASLLHDIGDLVDDVHERHWTRSNARRRAYHRAVRSQELVGHARATTGLVNGGCRCRMVHDSVQRIRNFQNKARRELSFRFAGVDQAGGVGDEFARQHDLFHGREKLVSFLARFRL